MFPKPDVYLQPLVVRWTSEPLDSFGQDSENESALMPYAKTTTTISAYMDQIPITDDQLVTTIFSNVPVIWRPQLMEEYLDLGQALDELSEITEDSAFPIEPPVYNAARFMANELMAKSVPAPRVFSHGPKSVVFNWTQRNNNLYLTISADRISALISSPERIKDRIEISCSPQEFFNAPNTISSLRSAQLGRPVTLFLTENISEPSVLGGMTLE